MNLRKSALYIASLVLLCSLFFSACGAAEQDSGEESDIAGRITRETGSTDDYAGWWELTGPNGDAPFVFIEIPVNDSSMVNCYDAGVGLIDTGFVDYSEQRALNGNALIVFVFQNIGEYGVTPYNTEDNRYLALRDSDRIEIELRALGEGIEPLAGTTPPDAPATDASSADKSQN